uniref:Calponin-homology (CH) domain-containing protein n=1 Tax=Scophthalmus maximus TaxID=52904 RepID=A0A8D3BZT3_SCOMX
MFPPQLQTFQVPSCNSKQDLTSGVAIAHVLHRIDRSWFNETWLGRIKEENGVNWRLKVSNLKKILKSMLEYYHDVLGHQVSDEHLPDVNLIGEMGDVTELGKLVQLVLGCAVSCEKKQEQIQQIMTLEESVQHVVMTAIQEVSEPLASPFPWLFPLQVIPALSHFFKHLLQCLSSVPQLSVALEEKLSLQGETHALKEKLSRRDSLDISTITGKKLLLLQSQMEQLQEENYRLENSRDDMRVRGEILEREVTDLLHRNEELTSLAQEAQAFKDEMDILRHSSDRVNQLETMVETYKRKLEDLGDLRRQVRLLEERNTVYMQRTCELEEELRRANAVRNQLDTYKRQNLNAQLAPEIMTHGSTFGLGVVVQKAWSTLRSYSFLCLHHSSSVLHFLLAPIASPPVPSLLSPPNRETVVRLQSENKMLCVQEESYRQKLVEVQAELEEAQRSRNTLETQNRYTLLLLTVMHLCAPNMHSFTYTHTLFCDQCREKLHEAHTDLQKKREVIDDLEPKVDGNMAKKIDELQEILRKKDEDMKQMEDRYKRYVEKARTVIKTLDPKQQPVTRTPDIQALKNQLTEKERRIHHLEHDFEKNKVRHDQEEKLLIAAWYNMGMALHQKVSGERLGHSNQAMSFLAQQRQSTNARRGLTRHHPR